MMGVFSPCIVLRVALLIVLLCKTVPAIQSATPLPLRIVHQFPKPTYLQDVEVGLNGDILMTTVFPDASIYRISGATSSSPTASLVHTFESLNAATGIIETAPGVFHVLAGKQGAIGVGIRGTFGVWELDLRPTYKHRHGKPLLREIVHIADGGLLLGVIQLPSDPNILLVSDSTLGRIWKVDTHARQYELLMEDASMVPPPWAALPFGIGGIQLHNGYLYYVTSFTATIYRIKLTEKGCPAIGAKVETVKELSSIYLDNFAIGPGGGDTIWAMTNADNRLMAITPDGNATLVAGAPDEQTMAGDVAAAFGKLPGDVNTLYVVTNGAMLFPINGSIVEGGKVIAVDTAHFLGDNELSTDRTKPVSGQMPHPTACSRGSHPDSLHHYSLVSLLQSLQKLLNYIACV